MLKLYTWQQLSVWCQTSIREGSIRNLCQVVPHSKCLERLVPHWKGDVDVMKQKLKSKYPVVTMPAWLVLH